MCIDQLLLENNTQNKTKQNIQALIFSSKFFLSTIVNTWNGLDMLAS
jgi:hypothetical protein